MTETQTIPSEPVRLAGAQPREPREVALEPGPGARAAIAAELGLSALRKLRLTGRLLPEGRDDWRLEAELGATVVQPCGVTLQPVTTRIDEPVTRRWLANPPVPAEGAEVEMPEDDSAEPLVASVDLVQVMIEALSLAIPPFPRAEGAGLGEAVYAPPGQAPLTDEAIRPFAGLAGLRDKLAGGAPEGQEDGSEDGAEDGGENGDDGA